MTIEEEQVTLRNIDKKLDTFITNIEAVLFDQKGNPGLCSIVNKLRQQVYIMWVVIAILAVTLGINGASLITAMANGG